MVAISKRIKTFQVAFTDPTKTFFCGGDVVSGRVEVEVNEATRVSAVRLLALGCAKVEYAKGKQRCRQEAEYLRHEELLGLEGQPAGEEPLLGLGTAAGARDRALSFGLSAEERAVTRVSLLPDSDGSVLLRPGNKYEYSFGFELPPNGYERFPPLDLHLMEQSGVFTLSSPPQAAGVHLQGKVRLRALLREGCDGETTAAPPGVQEAL